MRRIEIGIQYVLLDKVGIHRIRPRQSIGEQMDLKIGGFGAHVGRFVLSIAPSATTVSLGVTRRGRNDAKLKGSDVALGTTIPGLAPLASFWPRGGTANWT